MGTPSSREPECVLVGTVALCSHTPCWKHGVRCHILSTAERRPVETQPLIYGVVNRSGLVAMAV